MSSLAERTKVIISVDGLSWSVVLKAHGEMRQDEQNGMTEFLPTPVAIVPITKERSPGAACGMASRIKELINRYGWEDGDWPDPMSASDKDVDARAKYAEPIADRGTEAADREQEENISRQTRRIDRDQTQPADTVQPQCYPDGTLMIDESRP